MSKNNTNKYNTNKFSPEVCERAVRLVQAHRGEYLSLWLAVESIAPKIGCVSQTLLNWVKRHEVDHGQRDGVTTSERQRIKELEREIKERRRANDMLRTVSAFFAQAELDRKAWPSLAATEPVVVARCTVERLMRAQGRQGVRRGKRVRTPIPDEQAARPLDRVNRPFWADCPNPLWVSDFTYVSTWQGWLYVAVVIDVYARRIVGWRVSTSMTTDFVLDALEQALYDRRSDNDGSLIHHSDRGSQYVSIRYGERLAQTGVESSVGSRGDSYDHALAETINGLYKAKLIHRRAPWKTRESVELATLEWVAWFNHKRLFSSIGDIPPAEAEANDYNQLDKQPDEAVLR